MLRQARLTKSFEPLQIPYPSGFTGQKSRSGATEIMVGPQMATYTADEIKVIEDYLAKLPYPQALAFGTVFTDANDPLLKMTHDAIDAIEQSISAPSTRKSPGGGERQVRERVYILRENGYYGNGGTALLTADPTAV